MLMIDDDFVEILAKTSVEVHQQWPQTHSSLRPLG